MRLFYIYVKEEKPVLSTGRKKCKEIAIEVFEELPKDGSFYVMQEYERLKGKTMRIGVKAEGAVRVEIKGSWGKEIPLSQSENEKNMWYEKSEIWMEDGFETKKESIFGINSCGEWTVTAYGENGSILSMAKAKIVPQTLTIEQYTVMQMEVKKMFEELAFTSAQPDERTKIKELDIALFPIEKLEKQLKKWAEWLE
ncbi:hypothetical protein BTO30_08755 [Domibacillus antri]|uniref:Uncharacterized protein n=1 Tax=Domibacillus antri TaxID=1714264 RepID=A0A1Q8Q5G5_9BACI|nr:hypothetical protein [Domibacillus antri]OLN22568.1 hypothetical protein BTO30_08755 [Domibacillus antri]